MATATAKKATTKKATAKKKTAEVFDVKLDTFPVRIEGTSPLIMNRWTEKAKQMMLAKMEGGAKKTKRDLLDKDAEFLARFYMMKGKPKTPKCVYGLPSVWIKQAIIDACSFTGRQIFKTTARGAVLVHGEKVAKEPWDLVPIIDHDEPWMREDTVRNATGVADFRFRPQFDEWAVEFDVTTDTSILTPEQILNLLNRAGFSIGLGEWRPAKGGDSGRFQVVTS